MSGIGDFFGDIGDGAKWWWKNVGGGGISSGAKKGFTAGEQAGDQVMNKTLATPVVGPTLERTMEGMRWLRDNVVSQPLSTLILVGKYNQRNSAWDSDPFRADTWTKAWKAANHISPGQAAFLDPSESDRAMNAPLTYYKPGDAYLPPGFKNLSEDQQQEILKEAGMPAIGNSYIEKKRANSSWYKYGSGTVDFASAVFADPTAHGLGAASKLAKARNVVKMPKGGWSAADIDAIMNTTKVKALMDGIWRNKDNPQLLNNTELAKRSGMGPRFGAIAATLQDTDELSLFVRAGMGDKTSLDELMGRNALAEARITGMQSRLDNLGKMRTTYHNFPQMQALIDQQMDQVQRGINADVAMTDRYDNIIASQGLLDEIHYGSRMGNRASWETRQQNKYVTGSGRGYVVDNNGIRHHRLVGQGGYFAGPVTVVQMLKNAHPNGYMKIDGIDQDSLNELRGHLARIPGITPAKRAEIMDTYLKTANEHERKNVLEDVGRLGNAMVAKKHGLSSDMATEIYKEYLRRKFGAKAAMEKRYTAGLDPERMNAAGNPMHLDELQDVGGKVVLTPFTASRLMNGHTFQDLDVLDHLLSRHADSLMTLRQGLGNARDAVEAGADYLTYMWKFSTLFRLGYIPRVLGDDLGSQWAAAGTAAMALRGVRGVYNAFDNAARWAAKPALQAREANALAGAQYAEDEMALIKPQAAKLQRQLFTDVQQRLRDLQRAQRLHAAAQQRVRQLNPADQTAKARATRTLAQQRAAQLRAAGLRHQAGASPGKTQALNDLIDRHDFLGRYKDLAERQAAEYNASYQKVIQGSKSVNVDGRPFPAAFGGKPGAYAKAQISADESVGNLFAMNKQLMRGNLERSFDHGGKVLSAKQNPEAHMDAWVHAINNQIMQDPLSVMAVKGATVDEMVHWLKGRGATYRARLPRNIPPEEFARSAKYEVDQYLFSPEIRQQALTPEGVDAAFLKKVAPDEVMRPDVHAGEIGLSQLQHAKTLDRVVDKFYRIAATIPADRMSRHPLFNALYEGHLKRGVAQWKLQAGEGVEKMSVREVEAMAHRARQLSLRDTRKLVFDIAHRSDAGAALRFLSPFFSATTEAFQRWGRVIGDKPQIVGYAANWYNAPAYLGAMQDMDGNKIDEFGYTYIPQYAQKADGTSDYSRPLAPIKRLVPKSERYIITRLPKWVVDSPLGYALNVKESDGNLALSQNSINLVTQGDPWFNPGVGPIVQIPVNEFVKDKLPQAKLARELGILPFGVQGGQTFGDNIVGRSFAIAAPALIKNALTSMDTSDNRYQLIKMQIMNREIYNFTQEHHGQQPTKAQIGALEKKVSDRTASYWRFQAVASFLQPFATQRKDPMQFYYDQYNALRRKNSKTADDEFLARYGDSHFIFASEISNSQGVAPTEAAVRLAKEHGKELAQFPELAPLVIGPKGDGPFSPEAYNYELNHPLVPGSPEMMRTKMTADEAVDENRRRLGWSKYTKKMNELTAKLHKAGYLSFDDDGAEDFKADKKAWTQLWGEPTFPDGTPNPDYNEQWSKDFYTQDQRKYERLIPALRTIANSSLANEPKRSDLRKLQEYMGGRQALMDELNAREDAGDPHTLDADANEDLRLQWTSFVDGLIEESPRFGDLYHRYLSNDLGLNVLREVQQ